MSKQTKLYQALGLVMALCPVLASAADTATPAATTSPVPTAAPANDSEISKDEWLEKIKGVIAEPICKSFTEDATILARMKEQKISVEKCASLIPAISDKCQKKYYDSLPAKMNQESASKWGRTIGECIGGDFAVTYLYPNESAAVSELADDAKSADSTDSVDTKNTDSADSTEDSADTTNAESTDSAK
ncbi:MAG: hypothetical protein ACOVQX_05395 [Legionella sp.]